MTGSALDILAVALLLLSCLCGECPALMLALIGASWLCVSSGGGPRGGCRP